MEEERERKLCIPSFHLFMVMRFFLVFFFPSASAFYVSSRKCPRTFVLWLWSGGSFSRVSLLRAEIRGCDAVQNANAKAE